MSALETLNVSDDEFELFQRFVYQSSGIFLSPMKRALLGARLSRRIRQLGLRSFTEYYRRVREGGEEERRVLLDAITTNETHFFREPAQFDFLKDVVLPQIAARKQRRLRVWSGGCSTGEEPFTIAMVLDDALRASGFDIQIVATDISTRALEKAEGGEWPIERAAEIPERYLKKYMLKGRDSKEGRMRAVPTLRSMIEFRRVNLADDDYAIAGRFDIIFCRNVLIYFNAQSKRHVFERLIDRLVPGGYLFLGHAESGAGWSSKLVSVRPSVLRRSA